MHVLFIITCPLMISYVICAINEHPILIIVSFDAFRYNYLARNATPFLAQLSAMGTTTDHMENVFPTKTFPNHHSIATGVYPEVHGVVGNSFYDPELERIVKISPEMYQYNDDILPIWTLNEKLGDGRYSGVMMWPGSFYEYHHINATHRYMYEPKLPWYQRIDIVINWLTDESRPANLIMIYFEEPDSHSHIYGPDSTVVFNFLQQLDNVTQYLYQQLRNNGLAERANVIHLSDHGMVTVTPKYFIDLEQHLVANSYFIAETSPCLHFTPKPGFQQDVYNRLHQFSLINKHFKVYKKEEILDRWHYRNNRRIPAILTVADLGYAFQNVTRAEQYYSTVHHIQLTNDTQVGVHGYDNAYADMHPFFIAVGPAIRQRHRVAPFSTLDLYSLFCAILNIQTVPSHNGTFENVRDILRSSSATTSLITVVVGVIILSASILSCIIVIIIIQLKRRISTNNNNNNSNTFFNYKLLDKEPINIESQHLLEFEEI